MDRWQRFFQLGPGAFSPFNESPAYLVGSIEAGERDSLSILGTASYQLQDWYKLGARSEILRAHSFAFSVDALPSLQLGAYCIGIHGESSIYVSHFLRNSVSLQAQNLAENGYSGWGHDREGRRSQYGGGAPWEALNRHHKLALQYDAGHERLSCSVNGFVLHEIPGHLENFFLEVCFEAVGVSGDFKVAFDNLSYYSFDSQWQENISKLNGWDPQYAPVFVSYSHADKGRIAPLLQALRSSGVRVLGDWDFQTGDSLFQRISDGISRSGYVLLMLSKASIASRWVQQEMDIAMERELWLRRVQLLPILIEDCEIPSFLRPKLYLDLRNWRPDQLDQYEKLIGTLRSYGRWGRITEDPGPTGWKRV